MGDDGVWMKRERRNDWDEHPNDDFMILLVFLLSFLICPCLLGKPQTTTQVFGVFLCFFKTCCVISYDLMI